MTAVFIFFDTLNDLFSGQKKQLPVNYNFYGNPAVKDAIEAIGVPHTEVDIIIVNDKAVDFFYKLQHGDKVEVYPVIKSAKFPENYSLSEKIDNPEKIKFIADVHLGKMARLLRMLGFNTLYNNDFTKDQILDLEQIENTIILTRDVLLLKNKRIKSGLGYWLRSEVPEEQLKEVLLRFDLFQFIKPFVRCMDCNGILQQVSKDQILHLLEQKTIAFFDEFYQCENCKNVYWKGSHYERMEEFIKKLLKERD